MFYEGFYNHVTPISEKAVKMCADLYRAIDIRKLESSSITARYPAFYDCLGVMYLSEHDDGRWLNPGFKPEVLDIALKLEEYLQCLHLPSIKGKVLYSMSMSIMKPKAFIDWHYDMHARSMVCERLHIPVVTNGGVVFYSKWFTERDAHFYYMLPGSVYRLNNRTPHAVANNSLRYRAHLVFDFMDASTLEYLRDRKFLDQLHQNVLAPVETGGYAQTFIGKTRGEVAEPFRLFRYSKERVDRIGQPIDPGDIQGRCLWADSNDELINRLKEASGEYLPQAQSMAQEILQAE